MGTGEHGPSPLVKADAVSCSAYRSQGGRIRLSCREERDLFSPHLGRRTSEIVAMLAFDQRRGRSF